MREGGDDDPFMVKLDESVNKVERNVRSSSPSGTEVRLDDTDKLTKEI